MRKIVSGNRPDITPAQIIAGIPVLATLLHVFGVYHLSKEQEDALTATVEYAFVLLGADAFIRVGRAHADAKVNAAAVSASAPALPSGGPDAMHPVEAPLTPEEIQDELDLPSDAEEAAAPPPRG